MFRSISVDSPFPSGWFIVINRDCTSFPGVILQLHQHNQHTNPKHPTRALTTVLTLIKCRIMYVKEERKIMITKHGKK